jgi:hypothetical protein
MQCSTCFSEFLEKVNITWNRNLTVTYLQDRHWYLDLQNSNSSLSDKVTMLSTLPVVRPACSTEISGLYGYKHTYNKQQ